MAYTPSAIPDDTPPGLKAWLADQLWQISNELGGMTRSVGREAVIRIPSQFPTLQAAIDAYSTRTIRRGAKIVLLIESGHELVSGVTVTNGDYGHFAIRSEDAEVPVADGFTGHLLFGSFAQMPVLETVIDMRGLGEDGYAATEASSGLIREFCGIKNAGGRAVYVNGSRMMCRRAVLTGAHLNQDADGGAIWVTRTAMCHAEQANVSGSASDGVMASRASTLYFTGGVAEDCGRFGMHAKRSIIVGESVTIRRSADHAIEAIRGSKIVLTELSPVGPTIIEDAGNRGINADGASIVEARTISIIDATGIGAIAQNGSVINLRGSSVTGSGTRDLHVGHGGQIVASDVTTTNSANSGEPALADTNVSAFNAIDGSLGVIWAAS